MKGGSKTGSYALMLAATTVMVTATLAQPIFPLFIRSLGATTPQVGLLLSLKMFLPLILRIPLTFAGERLGKKRMIIGSLMVLSTAALMYSMATSYVLLVVIIIFESLSSASNQLLMATVSDLSPSNQQGDAMGRYLTFLGMGMLLGPALCSLLVDQIGYSGLYLTASVFPFIGIALVLQGSKGLMESKSINLKIPQPSARESLRMIFTNRNVLLLSYCRTSFATSQNLILTLFPLYASDILGYSDSNVALLFTVRGLSNTLIRLPAGKISDRIGRKKPMIVAYALLIVAFGLIATVKDYTLLFAAFALYGFSWGMRAVSEWAFLTDLVEPEIKTLSISYLSSIFSLGSTLGSIAAGTLATMMPYTSIFMIAAGLMIPPIPVITAMKKESGE